MEYLGAGGPEVNSSNVDLGITTLAINLNLNSYMETLKIEHYKHYKRFTPFQKNITNITIRTKKLLTECYASKESLMRNFHVSKKGKTPDKVSCVKEKKKLLTICPASNINIYIHNHEIRKNF